ncbi:MAG: hypothetical protein HGA19_00170 [Oscillochloris sp.]|nr:hypothetical protein [Oscillochloris sp.]
MIIYIMTFLLGVLVVLLLRPRTQIVERVLLVPQAAPPASQPNRLPLVLGICVFVLLITGVFMTASIPTSSRHWQSPSVVEPVSRPTPLIGIAQPVLVVGP